jgi:8-oxo-dGTP pyrophosphatase MutT (NUDIX family)
MSGVGQPEAAGGPAGRAGGGDGESGAAGRPAEVPVREAATVLLLRDGTAGLETWLMRRVPKMAFAAGMSVFPGGAVDAGDAELELPEHHVAPVADQLRTTPAHAGRLITAAIRETFEEVGVLLGSPAVVVPPALRASVEDRERSFADVLRELQVSPDVTAVRPWARWITPRGEARRYDTYFFLARLPEGLSAGSVTSEASHADWIPIEQALAEHRAGERPMLPPTFTTLAEVGRCATVQEALTAAAGRRIEPVQPVFRRGEDGSLTIDLGNGTVLPLPADFVSATGRTL